MPYYENVKSEFIHTDKVSIIQVKRPIKINKYHLKSLQDTY